MPKYHKKNETVLRVNPASAVPAGAVVIAIEKTQDKTKEVKKN